jgi:hypothetical protein
LRGCFMVISRKAGETTPSRNDGSHEGMVDPQMGEKEELRNPGFLRSVPVGSRDPQGLTGLERHP